MTLEESDRIAHDLGEYVRNRIYTGHLRIVMVSALTGEVRRVVEQTTGQLDKGVLIIAEREE